MKENPFIKQFIEENREKIVKKQFEYLEDRQFIKVFIGANEVLSSLQKSSRLIYEYLFKTLQSSASYNQTEIEVSFRGYRAFCRQNKLKPIAEVTFYRSRKELIEKGVIAEADEQGFYFFNINYFFNGDRFFVIHEFIRKNPSAVAGKKSEPVVKEIADKKEAVVVPEKESSSDDDFERVLEEARRNKKKSALAI